MSSLFFISDMHLDHEGALRHSERPFDSLDDMNEALVENWNSVVTQRDMVVIGGDFAWKRHAKWINALKGKKTIPYFVAKARTEEYQQPDKGLIMPSPGAMVAANALYPFVVGFSL